MSVTKSTTYPVTRVPAYYDDFDEKKVGWSILQSTCVASASLILLLICLFPTGKETFKVKHNQLLVVQSFEMAETFVLLVSAASFFFSFFQLLMIFKLLKTHHPDISYALTYIEKTSFCRILVQVFWLMALLVYITALLVTFVLDTAKSHASRGFAAVFGVFSLIFCIIFVMKTMRFWFISSNQKKLQPQSGSQFSTLV